MVMIEKLYLWLRCYDSGYDAIPLTTLANIVWLQARCYDSGWDALTLAVMLWLWPRCYDCGRDVMLNLPLRCYVADWDVNFSYYFMTPADMLWLRPICYDSSCDVMSLAEKLYNITMLWHYIYYSIIEHIISK